MQVPETKEANELTGEPTSVSSLTTKPTTGKVFIEIPIEEKAKCPATLKGTKVVEGEQVAIIVTPELKLTEVLEFAALGTDWWDYSEVV